MPDSPVSIAYRSAMEVITAAEPDVARAIVGELESQRCQLEAHRFRELRLTSRAARHGQLAVG